MAHPDLARCQLPFSIEVQPKGHWRFSAISGIAPSRGEWSVLGRRRLLVRRGLKPSRTLVLKAVRVGHSRLSALPPVEDELARSIVHRHAVKEDLQGRVDGLLGGAVEVLN